MHTYNNLNIDGVFEVVRMGVLSRWGVVVVYTLPYTVCSRDNMAAI